MKKIGALIVQGFPDVRASLREMIAREEDIVLLGEYEDGASGLRAIRKLRPQLLFLGVQLRGMDGFDVLKSLDGHAPAAVIFVSHFERYAMRAFEVQAADYLLKPFTRRRFKEALGRARQLLESGQRLAKTSSHETKSLQLLGVKVSGRIVLVKPDEIETIVAHRAYATVHTPTASHRARSSLAAFQDKLGTKQFIRINRSTLVNTGHVKEIIRKAHGDGLLRTDSGKEFPLSRRYRVNWSGLIS